MKKVLAFILATAMVFSLAACGAAVRVDNEAGLVEDSGSPAGLPDGFEARNDYDLPGTPVEEPPAPPVDSFAPAPSIEVVPGGYAGESSKVSGDLAGAGEPMVPGGFGGGDGTAAVPDPGSIGIIDDPSPMPVTDGEKPVPVSPVIDPVKPPDRIEPLQPSALMLTAAEWNDNNNWGFFTNLVRSGKLFSDNLGNSQRLSFQMYGLDPTNRVKVTVKGTGYDTVELRDPNGTVLWTAKADKNGVAYLFWKEGQTPAAVWSGDARADVTFVEVQDQGQEAFPAIRQAADVTLEPNANAVRNPVSDLQVMFIVDTTGSMGDEILYLQRDFAAIAGEVGTEGVEFAATFYRDEGDDYVTKVGSFSSDVTKVRSQLMAEIASGGGDYPEAVAEVLRDAITNNKEWREDAVKVAFLIFDARPHTNEERAGMTDMIDAAVKAAAAKGIRLVPVVSSGARRDAEVFGRALAILTGGTYVFLTNDSGIGGWHLDPIVGAYEVEKLHDIIVRIITNLKP